ncbi:MAG TPA: DNA-formamidopyrimidine glycosylase family protein [Thermoanaerobaculia bacterium]
MPELPEVEATRRYVEEHALDRTIERVVVHDRRILASLTPARLKRALIGSRMSAARRHGKHLFVATDRGPWLHLHLGMSGDLYVRAPNEPLQSALGDDSPPRFARLTLGFAGGTELVFDDARLFGRVGLVESPDADIRRRRLGIDALDGSFRPRLFRSSLEARRGSIKALLMNQGVVAGLGNLYVDEVLYQSSIHPRARVDRLTVSEIDLMVKNIRRVLTTAIARIEKRREHPRRNLILRRSEDQTCGMCGGEIRRATIAGRTTYFCARHQKSRSDLARARR